MTNFHLILLIPCALHLYMNVTKKLVALTVRRIVGQAELVKEFEELLKRIGVFLAPETALDENDQTVRFTASDTHPLMLRHSRKQDSSRSD